MACASSFYISIGITFALIFALFIATYTGLWGFLIEILNWVRSIWEWFLKVMPRPAQILIFFFFIVFVADVMVGGVLSMFFACDSSDNLRQPLNMPIGVAMAFECGLEQTGNISDVEYDAYVNNLTVPRQTYTDDNDVRSMMRVQCQGGDPRLTFYGLDFLDYKFWILLLIAGVLIKVYSMKK